MRRGPVAIAAIVAAVLLGGLAVGQVGGATVVTTQGNSMEPGFRTGDLAVLLPADSYAVGDVVAYRSALLETVVMHRIVARDGDRFVLQGDNNSWLDPELLEPDEPLGELALRVPQGGLWLDRLTSTSALAAAAALLLLTGGAAATTTRRSRRRNRTMSRHAARPTLTPPTLHALPPALQTAGTVAAGLGLLGLLAAGLAWTTPTTEQATTEERSGRSMTFSYSAAVSPSAAYDGTTVTSPDPVFRRLTDTVDVQYRYVGPPATIAVAAEVSTASGWRTTIPLPVADGTARLDLAAIEGRTKAAAAATGMSADRVSIRVVADVQTSGAAAFQPAMALDLTPLQLALSGDPSALTVTDASTTAVAKDVPRSLGLLGKQLPVSTVRLLSVLLLLAGTVVGAAVLLLARRTSPPSEAAGIHQRYGSLLVEVQPMTNAAGRPVVDVTAFSTLARLAERYGLLVLHWSRSGVETFVVQDDSTTFRYRSGASAVPEPEAPLEGAATATPTVLPYGARHS